MRLHNRRDDYWDKTPVPYRVHATLDEAVIIALHEIAAAGVEIPSMLLREKGDAVRREIAKVMSVQSFVPAR